MGKSSYHDSEEFAIVITRDATRTKDLEPAFFAFANTKQCLMDFTSGVFGKVLDNFFKDALEIEENE